MPGEIAEMMLDGLLCQGCGDFMGDYGSGEGRGYPGFCAACGGDEDCDPLPRLTKAQRRKISRERDEPSACPMCGKHKSGDALRQHLRDAHGKTMTISPICSQPHSTTPEGK